MRSLKHVKKLAFYTLWLIPLPSMANDAADEAVSVGVAVYQSEICQKHKGLTPLKEYWDVLEGFSSHQNSDISVDAQIRQSDTPFAACSFHAGWAIGAFMSVMND